MYAIILTLWFFNTQTPVISTVDGFKTEQLCKDAAAKWRDDIVKSYGNTKASAVCVAKRKG